ncbi:ribonuclease PH, partial [Alphaproteobacteria bacterium]|nr:ribonuclease PH [Alphaproteobacteria bacterium]
MTRKNNELRKVEIITDYTPYAEGSCLIKFGNTIVLCNATVETKVPPFLRGTGTGWITAEYGMLPRSTHERMNRKKSAESGRTHEIQRLIGRSLRSIVDVKKIGENQVRIDCDVIQADGGTRTASITGAWVALMLVQKHMLKNNIIKKEFIIDNLSAISCGIVD